MVYGSGREERGWRPDEKGCQNVGSRERPSIAQCREICRDLHGRLASLASRERTSESLPSFLLFWHYPLVYQIPTPPHALIVLSSNPCMGRSGLPDQKSIRGNRDPSVCLSDAKSNLYETLPRTSLYPSILFIVLLFFSFFFITHSIDDIRFPEKLVHPSLCKNHYLTIY